MGREGGSLKRGADLVLPNANVSHRPRMRGIQTLKMLPCRRSRQKTLTAEEFFPFKLVTEKRSAAAAAVSGPRDKAGGLVALLLPKQAAASDVAARFSAGCGRIMAYY